MKNVNTFICLVFLFIGASSLDCAAQSRPEKTSSAKAYYGYSSAKPKIKLKKKNGKVLRNYTHTMPAKGTQYTRASKKKYTSS
jgi:hypothetical protein